MYPFSNEVERIAADLLASPSLEKQAVGRLLLSAYLQGLGSPDPTIRPDKTAPTINYPQPAEYVTKPANRNEFRVVAPELYFRTGQLNRVFYTPWITPIMSAVGTAVLLGVILSLAAIVGG